MSASSGRPVPGFGGVAGELGEGLEPFRFGVHQEGAVHQGIHIDVLTGGADDRVAGATLGIFEDGRGAVGQVGLSLGGTQDFLTGPSEAIGVIAGAGVADGLVDGVGIGQGIQSHGVMHGRRRLVGGADFTILSVRWSIPDLANLSSRIVESKAVSLKV